jgi:hypothetical protein
MATILYGPTGSPLFSDSIIPGKLFLQEGTSFEETEEGFDFGTRIYETSPQTTRAQYPQRTAADAQYPSMFVTNVRPRLQPSTMQELVVSYKGIISPNGTAGPQKTIKVTPSCDVQMYTLPALQSASSTVKLNVAAPIPCPAVSMEYVTLTQPTLAGCGNPAASPFPGGAFPALPTFSISFYPDTTITQNANYYTGWVLESRTWMQTGIPCWLVTEYYKYYYSLSP